MHIAVCTIEKANALVNRMAANEVSLPGRERGPCEIPLLPSASHAVPAVSQEGDHGSFSSWTGGVVSNQPGNNTPDPPAYAVLSMAIGSARSLCC